MCLYLERGIEVNQWVDSAFLGVRDKEGYRVTFIFHFAYFHFHVFF